MQNKLKNRFKVWLFENGYDCNKYLELYNRNLPRTSLYAMLNGKRTINIDFILNMPTYELVELAKERALNDLALKHKKQLEKLKRSLSNI